MGQVSVETSQVKEELCVWQQPVEACGIVLFGASGDLAHRKLIPALFDLCHQRLLPERFFLLGVASRHKDDASFREDVATTLRQAGKDKIKSELWAAFIKRCHFVSGNLADLETYQKLAQRLMELERQHNTDGNRVFHLAIPPALYGQVVRQLGIAGLAQRSGCRVPWGRVILEKPLGRDLASAHELSRTLNEALGEDQIYRIDHYLGKETVQNVLIFRFANAIFEPIWNRRYVDHVQITVGETLGVEHRAGYYDQTGCLRDMFQNHLFQLLCLVGMEPPASFEAERLRDEKVKVMRAVRLLAPTQLNRCALRGQYRGGLMNAQRVRGYLEEPGVSAASTTETFAALKLFIDNWRWQDVPFYLRSGKRLKRHVTEIMIRFKSVPHSIFQGLPPETLSPNMLILRIQPDEAMRLTFGAKHPGPKFCMSSVTMDLNYQKAFGVKPPGAYEHLLLECMLGDQTLFARQDWVELSWSLLSPLLEAWKFSEEPPALYDAGTWGPRESLELIGRDGREWHNF